MSPAPCASFVSAADALADWKDSVLSGTPPTSWPIGVGAMETIGIGPGWVVLLGGEPGIGKSALVTQWIIDALRLTPTLKALIANVEMSVSELLDRQLARLTGIDLALIRQRQLGAEDAERLDRGLDTLDIIADRLTFLRSPFDLANVAASVDAVEADLVLLDYIQRFPPPGRDGDRRRAVDATIRHLRSFADEGLAIIAVSAVGRQKDARGGSSYHGLTIASFRESSELEFGADSAYLLCPDPNRGEDAVLLHNPKNRHAEPRDMALRFHRAVQRFEPDDGARPPRRDSSRLRTDLAELWAQTSPAAEEGED